MTDQVKDVMTDKVICFKEDDSIIKIAKEMRDKKISGVIIMRKHIPVGVITEKDMTDKVIANEMDINITKAKDIMNSPVRVIPPETNIIYASQLMKKTGYKRLPVSEHHKVVGIVTQSDILRYFNEQKKKMVLDALKQSNAFV